MLFLHEICHRLKVKINQHIQAFIVEPASFDLDAGLIFEKLQHSFSKFSKIKSFSQRQLKGWLSGVDQIHSAVYTNQIRRLLVKKILDKIVSAISVYRYLRFDYFRVL